MNEQSITDEELVALLHGGLSAEHAQRIQQALLKDIDLRARYGLLEAAPVVEMKRLFDQLLDHAPVERLERNLQSILLDSTVRKPSTGNATSELTSLRQKGFRNAIALVGFGFALLVGYLAGTQSESESGNWRESVALYQELYTSNTLLHLPNADNVSRQAATHLSNLSQMGITVPDLREQNLQFKRGQILEFEETPLVQLAYLSNDGSPVAVCFIQLNENSRPLQYSEIHGLKSAFWTQDNVSMMVIGELPQQQLEVVARAVIEQLG